jgi:branched-chain amino acid transport system ATP-binding protein
MLEVNNIEVVYANVIRALNGVSLKVPEGSIVALLGANGVGKSTTLKAISGLLATEGGRVTAGSIRWDGHRIENGNPEDIVKLGVVQVMEGRRIFEHLTVEQNLKAGGHGASKANTKEDLEMVYHYFPKLKDLRGTVSGYLSGGEQQMMVVGRALMAHPKLMLLDEPSLGLSPILVEEIAEIVQQINKEEKASILLVEQNARVGLDISHYGYVMEVGSIVLEDSAQKLKGNKEVKEFYLGLSSEGGRRSYKEAVYHYKSYRRRKRWLSAKG